MEQMSGQEKVELLKYFSDKARQEAGMQKMDRRYKKSNGDCTATMRNISTMIRLRYSFHCVGTNLRMKHHRNSPRESLAPI
jgi:hypothetical protein